MLESESFDNFTWTKYTENKNMDRSIISALEKVSEGDKEFMRELSAAFVNNFKEFSTGINVAIDEKNLSTFKLIVHKIKPSFLTIGLNKKFEELETFGKSLDLKSASEIEEFKSWVASITKETIDTLSGL